MLLDNPVLAVGANLPLVIQGGMGVGVSGWKLARTVSMAGQLGVVSGTAINTVLARRLQQGDPDGDIRRALAACPLKDAAAKALKKHFVEGGLPAEKPYGLTPLYSFDSPRELVEMTAVASFVEVFLAKEGNDGVVGINLLEKIQLPTLPTIYGAMLAGVDYVIMGAGIPKAVPGVLDDFAAGRAAELRLDVDGLRPDGETSAHIPMLRLDPKEISGESAGPLKRPKFLAVISAAVVALTLVKKASGRVDGFVVEGASAGGHNAPPRGGACNERGEPLYGPRDEVDLKAIRALERPFWLAGSYASREKLASARAQGAQGVQIGTAFAFCEESGITAEHKASVIAESIAGTADVYTDPKASPTGMPFKVVKARGTISDPAIADARERRRCDLGYLRQPYLRDDGEIGYRCPAEYGEDFLRKGGDVSEMQGRRCLCNGLLSAIGLGQRLGDGREEPALITGGSDVADLARFLRPGYDRYTARDVLRALGVLDEKVAG